MISSGKKPMSKEEHKRSMEHFQRLIDEDSPPKPDFSGPKFFFLRVTIVFMGLSFLLFTIPARIWNNLRKAQGLPGYETYAGGGWQSIGVSLFFWVILVLVIINAFDGR